MAQELSESAVAAALTTKWMGRNYVYYPQTGSTNDLLKREVDAARSVNLPAGTVYLTDFQQQGRGRLGRRWEAQAGTSLLFSVLFRPQWPAGQYAWLTMLAGLAVTRTLQERTNLEVSLKWPNDVLIKTGDDWRKVCGILLEGHLLGEQAPGHAILGIGLNINMPAEQLPDVQVKATSLLAATGQTFPG